MSGCVGSQLASSPAERAPSSAPDEATCGEVSSPAVGSVPATVDAVVSVDESVSDPSSEDDWDSEPPHPASASMRMNKDAVSVHLSRNPFCTILILYSFLLPDRPLLVLGLYTKASFLATIVFPGKFGP